MKQSTNLFYFSTTTNTGNESLEARFLDTDIGRFLSVDPLGFLRMGLNPYNYVQNNPVIKIDPTGMLDDDIYYNKGNVEVRIKNDKPDRHFYVKKCKDGTLEVQGEFKKNTSNYFEKHKFIQNTLGNFENNLQDENPDNFHAEVKADKPYQQKVTTRGNNVTDGLNGVGLSVGSVQEMAKSVEKGYSVNPFRNKVAQNVVSKWAGRAGGALAVVSVGGSLYEAYDSGFSNRANSRFAVQTVITAIGVFGGPVGIVLSIGLGIADSNVVFDSFYNSFDGTRRVSKP